MKYLLLFVLLAMAGCGPSLVDGRLPEDIDYIAPVRTGIFRGVHDAMADCVQIDIRNMPREGASRRLRKFMRSSFRLYRQEHFTELMIFPPATASYVYHLSLLQTVDRSVLVEIRGRTDTTGLEIIDEIWRALESCSG